MKDFDVYTATAHKHIMFNVERLLETKGILIGDDELDALHAEVARMLLRLQGK